MSRAFRNGPSAECCDLDGSRKTGLGAVFWCFLDIAVSFVGWSILTLAGLIPSGTSYGWKKWTLLYHWLMTYTNERCGHRAARMAEETPAEQAQWRSGECLPATFKHPIPQSESKEDDSLGIGNHHQSSLSWFTLGCTCLLPGSSAAGNQFGDAHLDGSLEAIVFHIEVPGAVGLPKPEVTYVQIAGLGLEEVGGRVGWFHKREEANSCFFWRVWLCVCVTFFLQLLCQHVTMLLFLCFLSRFLARFLVRSAYNRYNHPVLVNPGIPGICSGFLDHFLIFFAALPSTVGLRFTLLKAGIPPNRFRKISISDHFCSGSGP